MSHSCSSSGTDLFLKLQEQIKCPICLEIFVDPRTLSCQHVFCRKCIDEVCGKCIDEVCGKCIDEVCDCHTNEERKEIKCPKCRVATAMPNKGATSLPIAFHMNSLIDLYESEAIADDKAEQESKLCQNEMCPLHERVFEVYCSTCEEVVCTICGIRSHSNHECDLVSEVFDQHWMTITECRAVAKQETKKVSDALDAIKRQSKDVIKQGELIEDAVDGFVHNLVERLIETAHRVKQDVANAVGYKLHKLSIQKDGVEDMLTQLNSITAAIDSMNALSHVEVLRQKKDLLERARSACLSVNMEQLQPCQQADIKFIKDKTIFEKLEPGIGQIVLKDLDGEAFDEAAADHDGSASPDTEIQLECQTEIDAVPRKSFLRGFSNEAAAVKKNRVSLHVVDTVLPLSNVAKCIGSRSEVAAVNKSQSFKVVLPPQSSSASLSCNLVHMTTGATLQCVIRKERTRLIFGSRNSRYIVSYTPTQPGAHLIELCADNSHMPCQPSQLYVFPSNKTSRQRVHSIKGLDTPWGLDIHSNKLLVSEHFGHCIKVLEKGGAIVTTLGLAGGVDNCKFRSPKGLAVSHDDSLFVIDDDLYSIKQTTMDGHYMKLLPNNIGTQPLQFDKPSDLAIDSKGCIYVTDTHNHRVQVLRPDLSFSHVIGGRGHEPGKLSLPMGIAIDLHDVIHICDTGNSRVQKFTPSGECIGHFGQKILHSPQLIAIDDIGTAYVTDNEGAVGKVVLFDREGEYLCSYWNEIEGPCHLANPRGIAVDSYKNIYVCNNGKNEITVIGSFY